MTHRFRVVLFVEGRDEEGGSKREEGDRPRSQAEANLSHRPPHPQRLEEGLGAENVRLCDPTVTT